MHRPRTAAQIGAAVGKATRISCRIRIGSTVARGKARTGQQLADIRLADSLLRTGAPRGPLRTVRKRAALPLVQAVGVSTLQG